MKMGKIILLSGYVLALGSCAPTVIQPPQSNKAEIMRSYFSQVTRYDGIDANEALLIAQSEMIFRGLDQSYVLGQPQQEKIDSAHWGVRFYPINQNTGEQTSILVIIRKKDGALSWDKSGLSHLFPGQDQRVGEK
jgi:hypothetical protein